MQRPARPGEGPGTASASRMGTQAARPPRPPRRRPVLGLWRLCSLTAGEGAAPRPLPSECGRRRGRWPSASEQSRERVRVFWHAVQAASRAPGPSTCPLLRKGPQHCRRRGSGAGNKPPRLPHSPAFTPCPLPLLLDPGTRACVTVDCLCGKSLGSSIFQAAHITGRNNRPWGPALLAATEVSAGPKMQPAELAAPSSCSTGLAWLPLHPCPQEPRG